MIGNGVGVITKARSKPRNILRGVLATADTFDTPPSDLANITDGDPATVTGTGSKVMGGAGAVGNIVLDMGSVKTILLTAKMGMWTSASTFRTYVGASDDGNTYTNAMFSTIWESTGGTSETVTEFKPLTMTGRYIKIQFNTAAAATCNVKIYNIAGYELGL